MVTDRLRIGTVEETMNRLSAGEYQRWKQFLLIEQEKQDEKRGRG